MPAKTNIRDSLTPLQFLFTQPVTLEEGVARTHLIAGRLLGYAWENQRIIESYASMAQIGMLTLCEKLWENSLEALYLREPRRTEMIEVT
ncbi:MAG TPA: hypothetical protein VGA56_26210 [Opitutaceae bacterium]